MQTLRLCTASPWCSLDRVPPTLNLAVLIIRKAILRETLGASERGKGVMKSYVMIWSTCMCVEILECARVQIIAAVTTSAFFCPIEGLSAS